MPQKFLKDLNVVDQKKKEKLSVNCLLRYLRMSQRSLKIKFLAKTLSDIIESKSSSGSKTSKIKSHHNVGGLPNEFKINRAFKRIF